MAMPQLDEVRKMKSRRPFVPFAIVTTSGDRYLVEDRLQFAVGQTEMMCAVPKSGTSVRLRADEIAGVEIIEQKPAA